MLVLNVATLVPGRSSRDFGGAVRSERTLGRQ